MLAFAGSPQEGGGPFFPLLRTVIACRACLKAVSAKNVRSDACHGTIKMPNLSKLGGVRIVSDRESFGNDLSRFFGGRRRGLWPRQEEFAWAGQLMSFVCVTRKDGLRT